MNPISMKTLATTWTTLYTFMTDLRSIGFLFAIIAGPIHKEKTR